MRVEGCLKISPAAGQKWELPVDHIVVVGPSDGAKYPIPPQKVNLETLRGITHMRPRTGVMGAVMRIRNSLAYATHTFFQSSGFMYVHAPLITGADCEGAGEMFQVTSAAARSDAITPPPASDLPSWPLQVTTCDLAKVPMAAGDVLLIDNYRVLHGRDVFEGDRLHAVSWFGDGSTTFSVDEAAKAKNEGMTGFINKYVVGD